jgi:coenzyme F420-reducing hydrogenase gamma subunit
MGKPKLAVWKFASCDGCQLSLLNCEDQLLALADAVEIAYFLEASRATRPGPYDLSFVEGSVSTPHDAERIREVRRVSKRLVTLGACATAGGIQALRNLGDARDILECVYPRPAFIETLAQSTPIAAHVKVDFELRGCPIDRGQLLELTSALLHGKSPAIPQQSVCFECKANDQVCVMVAESLPCLGPVTQAGCGALCPAFRRGCYGCFGPKENANVKSMLERWALLGVTPEGRQRAMHTFNAWAEPFRSAGAVEESR